MKKNFGRNNQINCSCGDYYKFIGYLASHPEDVKLVFENNSEQGAWGNEGRIQFTSDFVRKYFKPRGINVTSGIGNIDSRLNCNAFFQELILLGFKVGNKQDISTIRSKIDPDYISDFEEGVNLSIN
ncbi:hypothetical protein [Neisseria zoodegmatis]|uniref:Uncharacterized protein n=1 Tax=Neisseria zoodegmatis TaxID=326523 RepID=A0AB38DR29_9NEIS|nr:hypothetical protein [Neisseria zoodegmatis]OSI09793.1 hypothetical protein BWD10_07340 [Neisseria zoodegmatis]SNU79813.1 Uncharacterised protein [Neisseria zoodegmatis]